MEEIMYPVGSSVRVLDRRKWYDGTVIGRCIEEIAGEGLTCTWVVEAPVKGGRWASSDSSMIRPGKTAWTVILLYLGIIEGTLETWMGTAYGTTAKEAIANARKQVIDDNKISGYEPEDFVVVTVIEGEHEEAQGWR